MSWNYRIIRYQGGSGFGLHEVYYNKDGKPWGMTEEAARFVCDIDEDAKEEIKKALEMALKDIQNYEVLNEEDITNG